MYRAELIAAAWALSAAGCSPREVAEALCVGRSTVQRWLAGDVGALIDSRAGTAGAGCSSRCRVIEDLPAETYAFLLGLYLGDGHISTGRNGVHRLTISCADDYPNILRACADAMAEVMPQSNVGFAQKAGCVAVNSYSRHWVCLFPQHGAGKKHERAIVLRPWQEAIVAAHPAPLVRGLIQSDGCRVENRVQRRGRTYVYPRYFFSNTSTDVMGIFTDGCDRMDVAWRMNGPRSVSVAQAGSVAILDAAVGPKT